ncbi:MAG: tRNA pseudouridine(55) synthase TruB [Pseudomonadota bacterium]|nr:tRNA pseudouridine(55) synthase TruB [Pseudomonadota bacterium]
MNVPTAVAASGRDRKVRERVDGVLLLDKPSGASSNGVLQHARRLFNAAKAGHTGTLDPLASGLLPVCFGEATKFSQALLESRKEYVATLLFGVSTTTGDAEGDEVSRAPVAFSTEDLERCVQAMRGTSQQVPPRYAALKYRGRNYYEYARSGIEIPRPSREIHLDTFEVVEHRGERAVVRIGCSKGTYVRTLAEDLAARLGTLAHLVGLRRVSAGAFTVAEAWTIDALEATAPAERRSLLLPVEAALGELPVVRLGAVEARDLIHGKSVTCTETLVGRLRAYDAEDKFLGVVAAQAGRVVAVRLVDPSRAPARGAARAPFSVES